MANALCGPSNPLQSFQKQTSVDRTLQRDRISSNGHFEQGFRSSPGPNAGILDAEFEAFQAGQPLGGGFPAQQPFAPGPVFRHHNTPGPKASTPSWAADFQNLQLNEARASPIPQPQFRQEAPLQHTAPGGWHQDFMRTHAQSPPNLTMQQQQFEISDNYGVYNNRFISSSHSGMPFSMAQQKQPEIYMEGDYDQADMERVFGEVSFEQAEMQKSSPLIDLVHDLVHMHSSEEIPVGSDPILEGSAQERQNHDDRDDVDELARTAGQLLSNVKHDHSQKFQNSSFLSLMRQLRDREVHVEGDKLVNTPQALHPGGQFYPADVPPKASMSFKDASDEGSSAMQLA